MLHPSMRTLEDERVRGSHRSIGICLIDPSTSTRERKFSETEGKEKDTGSEVVSMSIVSLLNGSSVALFCRVRSYITLMGISAIIPLKI